MLCVGEVLNTKNLRIDTRNGDQICDVAHGSLDKLDIASIPVGSQMWWHDQKALLKLKWIENVSLFKKKLDTGIHP